MSDNTIVQLRYATLPSLLRVVAVHHWFVVFVPEAGWNRWEVWQEADAGGTSWGHIHRDLMPPDRAVGGGSMRVAKEWRDAEAGAIRAVLEDPVAYPFRCRYRYYPGPNSNTYAAWVLQRAGIAYRLSLRGIGRKYRAHRD